MPTQIDSDTIVYDITKYLGIDEIYSLRLLNRDIYSKMTNYLQHMPKNIHVGRYHNKIITINDVAFVYHRDRLMWITACKKYDYRLNSTKDNDAYMYKHNEVLFVKDEKCVISSNIKSFPRCKTMTILNEKTRRKLFRENMGRPEFISRYENFTYIMKYHSYVLLCEL